MTISKSIQTKAAMAAVVLAAAAAAPMAQAASDVYFSIGAQVAPGVSLGVSNAPAYYPQAVYAPAPVYVQPRPYYVQPQAYYVRPAPVYVRPAPVYVRPAPVYGVGYYYGPPGHSKQRFKSQQRHHRHWD